MSKTFFVMGLSMGCSFIATITLANQLSIELFGQFNLLKSLFPMLSAILLVGIDKSYIKEFSKAQSKRILQYIAPLIIFNGILLTSLFAPIYGLYDYRISIFICIVLGGFNLFLSSYARLKKHYGIAQFMQNGHKIIFLIVIIILFNNYNIEASDIINIFLISLSLPALYLVVYLKSEFSFDQGINSSDFLHIYKYGFLFFCVNIFNLFIVNMEKLAIPYIYGNESLGIYIGLSFVYMTIFTMIGTSMGFVLFPELLKNKNINIKKIMKLSIILMIALSIFFLLFGYKINSIVYQGRFDLFRSWGLDIMIISIAAIQFINAPLHWFVLALGKKQDILLYLKVIILVLVIYSSMIFYATSNYSIDFLDIIPIVLFGWVIKLICTLWLIKKINLFNNY